MSSPMTVPRSESDSRSHAQSPNHVPSYTAVDEVCRILARVLTRMQADGQPGTPATTGGAS